MNTALLTSLCLVTFFVLYNDSRTPSQHTHNMPPMPGLHLVMALNSNLLFLMSLLSLTFMIKNVCRRFLVPPYCIMPMLLTVLCYLPLVQWLHNKQPPLWPPELLLLTFSISYCATHPEATLRYTASDMILHVESNASYLSGTRVRSRAAGIHFLSCKPLSLPCPTTSNALLLTVLFTCSVKFLRR